MTRLDERFRLIAAVFVIFRDSNKILMLRRANSGYYDGHYSLPAGHVDGDEPAEYAAIREAREETGLEVAPEDLHLVHTMHLHSKIPTPHERINLFFEATAWRGKPRNLEPDKCDELIWATLTKLPAKVTPEVHQALECVAQNQAYSHYGF